MNKKNVSKRDQILASKLWFKLGCSVTLFDLDSHVSINWGSILQARTENLALVTYKICGLKLTNRCRTRPFLHFFVKTHSHFRLSISLIAFNFGLFTCFLMIKKGSSQTEFLEMTSQKILFFKWRQSSLLGRKMKFRF